jgi:hypothetical protein
VELAAQRYRPPRAHMISGGAVRSVEADMTEPAEDHVDCHACFEKVHGRPCAGKCAAIPVVPCARGALHRLYPRETHA